MSDVRISYWARRGSTATPNPSPDPRRSGTSRWWRRHSERACRRYERTDKYDRLYDFTPEEELEYYRRTNAETVERVFLAAFQTRRRDHYKYRNEILEPLVQRYMVHTVRCPTGTRFDSPCNRYVREVYDSLCRRGLLIQVEKKNDAGSVLYYCRSADAAERRALGYHD